MGAMASQISNLAIVYLDVYSGADRRKHQSSTSLAFVWGIHRGPVNSPHKWPVMPHHAPMHDKAMSKITLNMYYKWVLKKDFNYPRIPNVEKWKKKQKFERKHW